MPTVKSGFIHFLLRLRSEPARDREQAFVIRHNREEPLMAVEARARPGGLQADATAGAAEW